MYTTSLYVFRRSDKSVVEIGKYNLAFKDAKDKFEQKLVLASIIPISVTRNRDQIRYDLPVVTPIAKKKLRILLEMMAEVVIVKGDIPSSYLLSGDTTPIKNEYVKIGKYSD